MVPEGQSGDAERVIRRFADACARRDSLLEICHRAMTALLNAAHHLENVESIAPYSINSDASHDSDHCEPPAYPSRSDVDACLLDLATISAEIRALRMILGPSASQTPAGPEP
jgi:hypothetical protein